MDATTNGLLIAAIATFAGNIAKMHFDEVRRRSDREQDRLDREQSATLTAAHRDLMAAKLDANTDASLVAAEASVVAAAQTGKIVEQTNGMQQKLMKIAGDAGFQRGVDSEKHNPTP